MSLFSSDHCVMPHCAAPQASGADLVIALTHMRQPNDILLAQQVPEIDAVLGGHDHFYNVSSAVTVTVTQLSVWLQGFQPGRVLNLQILLLWNCDCR
jgi:2',3'-cyclic-nucleotide 2'-phosphodiesterase (5'-nucleotidase family)